MRLHVWREWCTGRGGHSHTRLFPTSRRLWTARWVSAWCTVVPGRCPGAAPTPGSQFSAPSQREQAPPRASQPEDRVVAARPPLPGSAAPSLRRGPRFPSSSPVPSSFTVPCGSRVHLDLSEAPNGGNGRRPRVVHIQKTARRLTEPRPCPWGWGCDRVWVPVRPPLPPHTPTAGRSPRHCHRVPLPLGALTPTPRKEPRKLPLGVERPRPVDLDVVARVLADAVHGVGAAGPWPGPGRAAGERPREPAGSSEDGGAQGGDGLRGEPPPALGGRDGECGPRPARGGHPFCPGCGGRSRQRGAPGPGWVRQSCSGAGGARGPVARLEERRTRRAPVGMAGGCRLKGATTTETSPTSMNLETPHVRRFGSDT